MRIYYSFHVAELLMLCFKAILISSTKSGGKIASAIFGISSLRTFWQSLHMHLYILLENGKERSLHALIAE